MITAGDFKKGITVEWDGGVWIIVDFQHVKPGKGAAFVRTKIKNVMTGAVVERNFVTLEVTDTEPGFKGDTASNTYKPATVETGYTLQVPLFINTGDMIRIDTRTGEYMERA